MHPDSKGPAFVQFFAAQRSNNKTLEFLDSNPTNKISLTFVNQRIENLIRLDLELLVAEINHIILGIIFRKIDRVASQGERERERWVISISI